MHLSLWMPEQPRNQATNIPGLYAAGEVEYQYHGANRLGANSLLSCIFTGLWIAKDADQKRFSRLVQAPILILTFLAGPFGLGVWLLVRERRARAVGNRRGIS